MCKKSIGRPGLGGRPQNNLYPPRSRSDQRLFAAGAEGLAALDYFLWLLPILCLVPYWPALLLTAMTFILYATLGLPVPSRDLVVNSLLYGPSSSLRC